MPGQKIARIDLHLDRLASSAAQFDIVFDPDAVLQAIDALWGQGSLRCRLTLAPDGRVELTSGVMPEPAKAWRFAVSAARLRSDDPFLRHKTTRRALYDQARTGLPTGIDEVLFRNERGELCEGSITNLVLTMPDGTRLTPALTSGCLPGVYRQSLLNTGQVREVVLTLEDLAGARSIALVNSLRGETPAIWSANCAEFASFA
ncbi:aminotransferase class IV family protein [Pseudophaeobacter sp.]|uniref:aminotransferase class IV family protein n=1 Tax=Pseudophaeobacter sp. TaxID=1971739 RepID=UPI0032992518